MQQKSVPISTRRYWQSFLQLKNTFPDDIETLLIIDIISMIPVKYAHGIIGSVSMGTIWHGGFRPQIINPIQSRPFSRDVIASKNQQYLIRILFTYVKKIV